MGNTIFFCGGSFALEALRNLISNDIRITKVVCSDINNHGITKRLIPELIKHSIQLTTEKDLTVLDSCDYIISYGYERKIKSESLKLARKIALNFHSALLPKYAGWHGAPHAILNGEEEFGVSCHEMDQNIDSGPIVQSLKFEINPTEHTGYSLYLLAQSKLLGLLNTICHKIKAKELLNGSVQNPEQRIYMTKKEYDLDRIIPIDSTPELIKKYSRAFFMPPYQGAIIKFNNEYVEVLPTFLKEFYLESN